MAISKTLHVLLINTSVVTVRKRGKKLMYGSPSLFYLGIEIRQVLILLLVQLHGNTYRQITKTLQYEIPICTFNLVFKIPPPGKLGKKMSREKAAYYALISENKTASIQRGKLENPPVLVTVKSTSHI